MKSKSKSLFSGGFLKNIGTLLTGKAGAALATLLLTPVVARIFDPSVYGVAALFFSIATIVSPLATLCYEFASVLPKSDREARQLTLISCIIAIVVPTILLAMVGAKWLLFPEGQYVSSLGAFEWLLPLMILLIALASVAENWHVRTKGYVAIAKSDVYRSLSIPGSRIAVGLAFGGSAGALIAGLFIGTFTKLYVLWLAAKSSFPASEKLLSKNEATMLVKQYRDFPYFNTPTRTIRKFSNDMPVIMLGLIYSPLIVGLYAMAHRLIMMPVSSVAYSVRKVFLEKMATTINQGEDATGIFIKMVLVMAALGVVPFTILGFWGQEIISILLGDRWLEAGAYVEILIPWVYSLWISAPCTAAFIVLRKQKYFMVLQFAQTFFRAAVFAAAYFASLAIESTLIGFTVVSVLTNVILVVMVYWLTSKYVPLEQATPA